MNYHVGFSFAPNSPTAADQDSMVLVNYVAEVVLQCLHRKYIRAKYGRKINSAPRNGIESEPPYATGI